MSDSDNILRGYIAVFNSYSKVLTLSGRKVREIIKPGAFKATLADAHDIKALVGHNCDLILGSTQADTLRLWEDNHGLAFELEVDRNISYANDLCLSVERGDICGCSFYMDVPEGYSTMTMGSDGIIIREVTRIHLPEVTITPFPAYEDTAVGIGGEMTRYSIEPKLRLAKRLVKETSKPITAAEALAKVNKIEKDIADDKFKANSARAASLIAQAERTSPTIITYFKDTNGN